MHPTQWIPPGERRKQKKEQKASEAEHVARAGRSLVTDEERATLSQEELHRLAYSRWMERRKTGRIAALPAHDEDRKGRDAR